MSDFDASVAIKHIYSRYNSLEKHFSCDFALADLVNGSNFSDKIDVPDFDFDIFLKDMLSKKDTY